MSFPPLARMTYCCFYRAMQQRLHLFAMTIQVSTPREHCLVEVTLII
ncbi:MULTISPECIES: hypothetical protein [unclassified Rickettsia]